MWITFDIIIYGKWKRSIKPAKLSILQSALDNELKEKHHTTDAMHAYVDMKEEYFTLRWWNFTTTCGKCEGSEESNGTWRLCILPTCASWKSFQ